MHAPAPDNLYRHFIDLWEDTGPRYEIQQAFWNRRAKAFSEQLNDDRHRRRFERLYGWLKDLGAFEGQASILDIGCGPGTFAIPFAEAGHRVTGIDIAANMIAHAKANAVRFGVSDRTAFEVAAWEEIDVHSRGWERTFDLVFASMTPAIRNVDAFYKMMQVCRKACFLSGFVARRDPILRRLRQALGLPSEGAPMNRIYAAFNLLWLDGYYPTVHFIDDRWEQQFSIEEASERFSLFLRFQSMNETGLEERVARVLHEIAEEQGSSVLRQTVEVKIAWLYWRVDDRSRERS